MNPPQALKRARKKLEPKLEPSEHDIQKSILDYLTMRHIFAWRTNSAAFGGEYKGKKRFFRAHSINGVSDILAIFPKVLHGPIRPYDPIGQLWTIEVKKRGNHLDPAQIAFRDAVLANGGKHTVAYSVKDVEDALR